MPPLRCVLGAGRGLGACRVLCVFVRLCGGDAAHGADRSGKRDRARECPPASASGKWETMLVTVTLGSARAVAATTHLSSAVVA